MNEGPLLDLQDVEFRYTDGPFVLRLESLKIRRGEHSACIGPSGSGKTTLLNLVSGILVPSAGSVRFAGIELNTQSDAERRALRLQRIGLLLQRLGSGALGKSVCLRVGQRFLRVRKLLTQGFDGRTFGDQRLFFRREIGLQFVETELQRLGGGAGCDSCRLLVAQD